MKNYSLIARELGFNLTVENGRVFVSNWNGSARVHMSVEDLHHTTFYGACSELAVASLSFHPWQVPYADQIRQETRDRVWAVISRHFFGE